MDIRVESTKARWTDKPTKAQDGNGVHIFVSWTTRWKSFRSIFTHRNIFLHFTLAKKVSLLFYLIFLCLFLNDLLQIHFIFFITNLRHKKIPSNSDI